MSRSSKDRTPPPAKAPADPARDPRRYWLLLGLGGLLVGGALVALWLGRPPATGPDRAAASDEGRRLLEAFQAHLGRGDGKEFPGLGAAPVFDDEPVSEAEADARCADYYLHRPELRIVAVRPVKGKPGHYRLVTKVQGSTPPLRVRNEKGIVESPSRLFLIDPDLVVELKGGKVHGVRAELRQD